MPTTDQFASLDDKGGLTEIADALRAWNPQVELDCQVEISLLFAPDATVYAMNLAGPCTVAFEHRRRAIQRGDLVVVPPGIAVEVDGGGRFLQLRDYGPPPPQFRERFLQVHGFEVRPPGIPGTVAPQGHRIRHRVVEGSAGSITEIHGDIREACLLVGLEGRQELNRAEDVEEVVGSIHAGTVVHLRPDTRVQLRGSGELLIVRIPWFLPLRSRSDGSPCERPH